MLRRHFYYYLLKPYIPVGIRLALRRIWARWRRSRFESVWPINEAAGRTPAGWPGWPDQKKFAVVLTHDIEGAEGLARCQHLASIEMRLGFRSSFNFIPEGTYAVPADLRSWLTDNGFEVGVHDLKHDGKLYSSEAHFQKNADRINQYLKDWNAVGFRSGFMHHHQGWLHKLNVQYDASTFDTDPFEPQPDGTATIFPFWVPSPKGDGLGNTGTRFVVDVSPQGKAGAGFVELPYTLPQDSTLFVLLREKTGDIWHRKIDWIAKNRGMVLVNVHPDYLHYQTGDSGSTKSSEDHYVDLLTYLKDSYAGSYWHALPREVASFVRYPEMPTLPRP